jgi:predicted amidohydrolase YtcJ
MTTGAIEALAGRALDAGLAVATHAIGDLAVERTLDAYEHLLRARPSLDPRRLRIEHFSYARQQDFARAVRLGVVLSIQSDFNASPDDTASLALTRTGAANAPRVYAWRRLFDMGARLIEGSDAFVRLRAPLAGYHDAMTLKNAMGDGPVDARIRRAALAMQMAHLDPDGHEEAGRVEPGARADLIVLDRDPLTVPARDLPAVRVLATVNDGRLVFRAGR